MRDARLLLQVCNSSFPMIDGRSPSKWLLKSALLIKPMIDGITFVTLTLPRIADVRHSGRVPEGIQWSMGLLRVAKYGRYSNWCSQGFGLFQPACIQS